MNKNCFLKGVMTGKMLKARRTGTASSATTGAPSGVADYDKESFLSGLAVGMSLKGYFYSLANQKTYPILLPDDTWYKGVTKKSNIRLIYFHDIYSPSAVDDVKEIWDASEAQDRSIMAYLLGDSVLHVSGNGSGKIMMNQSAMNMFGNINYHVDDSGKIVYDDAFTSLEYIYGSEVLDASLTEEMYNLFARASKLKEIPIGMFSHCENVARIIQGFYQCTSLTEIPDGLLDSFENLTSVIGIFYGNINIKNIPESLFYKCHKIKNFDFSFAGTGIITIPAGLFSRSEYAEKFDLTFQGCQKLEEIPDGLFDYCPNAYSFKQCFGSSHFVSGEIAYDVDGPQITAIPEKLFANCKNANNFLRCFGGCTKLKAIPKGLFENCSGEADFRGCFNGCTSLNGEAPELWNTHPNSSGKSCFYKCTRLSNYAEIPSLWKEPITSMQDFM